MITKNGRECNLSPRAILIPKTHIYKKKCTKKSKDLNSIQMEVKHTALEGGGREGRKRYLPEISPGSQYVIVFENGEKNSKRNTHTYTHTHTHMHA